MSENKTDMEKRLQQAICEGLDLPRESVTICEDQNYPKLSLTVKIPGIDEPWKKSLNQAIFHFEPIVRDIIRELTPWIELGRAQANRSEN